MIKNPRQAIAVQRRRLASGKKGVAKAVRRFHNRMAGNKAQGAWLSLRLDADFSGCRTFNETHGPNQ